MIHEKSMFVVLQEGIDPSCAAVVQENVRACVWPVPGFTGIPSTSVPAERSDSPSTQDTLARGVFQVPQ